MKKIPLAAIRFYQRRMSSAAVPSCRFQPTCSQYAYDAIETWGTLRGIGLGVWRILRCNPLNDGGFDPVPERRKHRNGHSHA